MATQLKDITVNNTDGTPVTFEVFLDKPTAKYTIKEKGTGNIIFENDKFDFNELSKLKIPDGAGGTDPIFLNLQQQAIDASKQLRYKQGGGQGSRKRVSTPYWAQGSNVGKSAQTALSNKSPQNNPIAGFVGNLGNFANAAIDPQSAIGGILNDTYGSGGLPNKVRVYPENMQVNSQDCIVISQFTYKAPNQDQLLTKGSKTIFDKGVDANQRYEDHQSGKVILPMPATFSEKKDVKYGEDSFDTLTAGATQFMLSNMGGVLTAGGVTGGLGALMGGGFDLNNIGGAFKGAATAGTLLAASEMAGNASGKALIGGTFASSMLKGAGFNVSAETILARGVGVIPNPNLELLFQGPALRTFGLAYRLTARSDTEGKIIREIIRYFKQGMSPRRQTEGNRYFLKTPNVFKVEFLTGGQASKSMPKFKTLALTGFETDYSPDKMWAAYSDGQPVTTSILIEFGELEPVYEDEYEDFDIDDIGY